MKALLLHRDTEVSRDIRLLLERHGVAVTETSDGLKAVEFAVADPPDLILVDQHLTRLGGFDAVRIIKAVKKLSAIPTVILTGSVDPGSVREAVDVGAVDFLLTSAVLSDHGVQRILQAGRRRSIDGDHLPP